MTPFFQKKRCAYDSWSFISLELTSSKLTLEVRSKESLVTRMDFPYSKSGLLFARRVYNGLQ